MDLCLYGLPDDFLLYGRGVTWGENRGRFTLSVDRCSSGAYFPTVQYIFIIDKPVQYKILQYTTVHFTEFARRSTMKICDHHQLSFQS